MPREIYVSHCTMSLQQEQTNHLKIAVAGLAAAALLMAHSPAAMADGNEDLKKRICAAQPTAKICRDGSAKST